MERDKRSKTKLTSKLISYIVDVHIKDENRYQRLKS